MLGRKTHRTIYIVLLALLGGCMVTSTYASNLVWVLLSVNWLCEGRWREKWQMAKESRLLHAYMTIYLALVVGMLWTGNTAFGLSVLQVKLPLLVVPLIILTTERPRGIERFCVEWVYIITLFIVTIIAVVRMITIPELPYRDAVPYISHIRFALNCCMVIFILVGEIGDKETGDLEIWSKVIRRKETGDKGVRSKNFRVIIAKGILVVWLLAFLVLIRSFTAFAVLAVVSLVMILAYHRRWPLVALWVLIAGLTVFVIGREVKSYYHMVPLAEGPLAEQTANGRSYSHANDGIIENGNYINNYVCSEELRKEWNNRSSIDYDDVTADGYSVESTLVRYLNAMGQTKDSMGVAAMSDADIDAVERGVANPVYEGSNPLRKMVYVMLLEREFYVHTHAVAGFTMLQRFELWRTTVDIIKDNPLFGVGTGDAVDELHSRLENQGSELTGTTKRTHNEYLSLMAMIGIVGFAAIVFMFIRAIPDKKKTPCIGYLMTAWILTILISCVTEDTLDTLAGILFCSWFLALRGGKGA